MCAKFKMNFNTTFAMIHFLKLCYNVFILENNIDALVVRKICIKMCYITLEIVLVCVNMELGFVAVYDKSEQSKRQQTQTLEASWVQAAIEVAKINIETHHRIGQYKPGLKLMKGCNNEWKNLMRGCKNKGKN